MSARTSVSPSASACTIASAAVIDGDRAAAAAACPSGVLATCSAASSAVVKQPRWTFLPSRLTFAWYGLVLQSRSTDTLRKPLCLSERASVSPSASACAIDPSAVIGGGRAVAACASGILETPTTTTCGLAVLSGRAATSRKLPSSRKLASASSLTAACAIVSGCSRFMACPCSCGESVSVGVAVPSVGASQVLLARGGRRGSKHRTYSGPAGASSNTGSSTYPPSSVTPGLTKAPSSAGGAWAKNRPGAPPNSPMEHNAPKSRKAPSTKYCMPGRFTQNVRPSHARPPTRSPRSWTSARPNAMSSMGGPLSLGS
eukprot:scaffold53411_cov61-Phaeocystis_antarctica.AAC.2